MSARPRRRFHAPRMSRPLLLSLALVAAASCGGSHNPVGPGSTAMASDLPGAGGSLVLTSGETGQPVAGASVTLGPATLASDGAGRVAIPPGVDPHAELVV